MKQLVKSGLILIFAVLFCTGLIFLPEYAAKQGDHRYMNQFKLYERDTSTNNLITLPLDEKFNILWCAEEYKNINQVLSIYTCEDLNMSDKHLLYNLDYMIRELENWELIPSISHLMSWQFSFSHAEFYNLSLPDEPGNILSVWELTFIDYEDNCRCYFTLDADTYQIYEATITGHLATSFLTETDELDSWGNSWMEIYGKYLSLSDRPNSISAGLASITSDYGILGYLNMDNKTYYMEVGFTPPGDYSEANSYAVAKRYNEEEMGYDAKAYETFYFHPAMMENAYE